MRFSAGVAEERAAEDRVVPVHRELVLRREGAGVVRDGVAESPGRELPVGLGDAERFGERDRAAQRVEDRRRAGQQGVALAATDRVQGPRDRAVGELAAQHEVEGALDDRPQFGAEVDVVGRDEVVVEPGRHVGADVRVEARVLHLIAEVVVEPTAVAELRVGEASGRPPSPRPRSRSP